MAGPSESFFKSHNKIHKERSTTAPLAVNNGMERQLVQTSHENSLLGLSLSVF